MPALPVSVVKIVPKDVAISNEWLGTMDGNVNAQIQPQASGYLVRQLYTDQDEVLFDATRPVILNGIEDIVTRPDLADRALFLTLQLCHFLQAF